MTDVHHKTKSPHDKRGILKIVVIASDTCFSSPTANSKCTNTTGNFSDSGDCFLKSCFSPH